MSVPDESTGAGVRAMQRICLVPESGSTVVVGEANTKEGRAELRTLGYLQAVNERRFGQELPIDKDQMWSFLGGRDEGARAVRAQRDRQRRRGFAGLGLSPPPPPRAGRATWIWAVVVAALVVGSAVAWLALRAP